MSPLLVSFIFGLGASAWVYSKVMNRTGGNTQSALVTAGVSGLALAILFFLILTTIDSMIS